MARTTHLQTERERLIRIEEKRVEAELTHAAGWQGIIDAITSGAEKISNAITSGAEKIADATREPK